MSGALAIFQGWVCSSVRLSRARGFGASISSVEFHVYGYPGTVQIQESEEVDPINVEAFRARLLQGRTISGTGDALPQPGVLRRAGELVLLEVDRAGKVYQLRVRPLYVVRVETVRRANRGQVSRVRVTLADARLTWDRGGMSRWSWNRYRADGSLAYDSLRAGSPWTLTEIAEQMVDALHGDAKLGHAPQRFAAPAGPINLSPYPAAVEALGELVRGQRLAEPCLAWDGSVGLWDPGEGLVAAAGTGADGFPSGAENVTPLPAELVLHKGGTGKGHTVELSHPPEVAIVVAGPRVATCAVDDWEPCLFVQGRILPLTEDGRGEATVRKLTNGRFGLDWLKFWILGPKSHQDTPGLGRELADLFASQAWRLYRLPGVEVPLTPGAEDTEVGPNAHLLPLLERAETNAGRRIPVTVETYSYSPVTHELRGEGAAEDAARAARRALATLKRQIRRAAGVAADQEARPGDVELLSGALLLGSRTAAAARTRDPFDGAEVIVENPLRPAGGSRLTPGTIRDLLRDAEDLFTTEDVAGAVATARLLDRITEATDAGYANLYKQALDQLYKAEGRGRDSLLEAAREVLALEKRLLERANSTESVEERLQESSGEREAIRASLRNRLLALRREREEERLRSRLSGGAPQPARARTPQLTHVNRDRSVDAGAVVLDPDLGLIRTSRLAGWLHEPAVPVAHATFFVPKAVRVLFGATLRPKVSRPITQQPPRAPGSGGGDNYVPEALSDEESWFTAWYRRESGQVSHLDPSTLPADDREKLRAIAVTLHHPELGAELVPLAGGSNADVLRLGAEPFARQVLLQPGKVEEARLTLARPWAVNCDGVVSGVEITMREGARGFETLVVTGFRAPEIQGGTRERPRARHQALPDSAAREGNRA